MSSDSVRGTTILAVVLMGATLLGTGFVLGGSVEWAVPTEAVNPTPWAAPVADAGPDVAAVEGEAVVLTGGGSPGTGFVTVWTEDFESYAPGAPSPPWVDESVGGTNYAEISITRARSGGQSLHLFDSTGGPTGLGTVAARPIAADAVELTTWAYALQTTGVFTPTVSAPGGGPEWQTVRAGMGPTGTFIYGVCTGPWSTSTTPYLANVWYELRLIAEIATGTYDMYVDGALIAAGVPLCGAATSFDMVRMVSAGSYTGEFFVDDLTYREIRTIPITDVSWDLNAAEDVDGDLNFTNDQDLVAPSGSVTFGDDGDYLVTLTVTDANGMSANDTALVSVSNAMPRGSLAANSPVSVSVGTTVTVDAIDDGSDDLVLSWDWSDGMAGSQTFLNGATPDPPMSPNGTSPFDRSHTFARTFPSPGLYTVAVTVEDDDGASVLLTEVVNVRDVPVTTMSIGPPNHVSTQTFVSASSPLTLSPTDRSGSGIDVTFYRVDGGSPTVYASPFSIATEGAHTVGYWSTDLLGGIEAENVLNLFVDATPPIIEHQVVQSSEEYAFAVVLLATDAGSGVATLEYRIDGGPWTPYEAPLLLKGRGTRAIEFRSADRVGNVGAPAPLLVAPTYVNYKPLLSVVLAVLLVAAGLALSWRRAGFKRSSLVLTSSFAGIELALGFASALFDVLLFPPWLGAGLLVNVTIAVAGVLAFIAFQRKMPPPQPE